MFEGRIRDCRWFGLAARMCSSSSSPAPVTPTQPLRRVELMQRWGSNPGVGLTSRVVAEDSDSFWKLELSEQQRASCVEAVQRLRCKLMTPDVIEKEFTALERIKVRPERFRAAGDNKAKNRYLDVLPFDETRVILQPTGESESDYINASFIEDPSRACLPTFIATQGPLRSTVVDFWEMVMQYRCPGIVMLTSFVDGNMDKCAPYFPSKTNQHQVFGRLKVTNKATSMSSYAIAKRVFEVKSLGGSEPPLNVLHLEYLCWPDHGVPTSTRPIRELFRCMSFLSREVPGPLVVHCSAGIGRSGTYIVIDHSVRRILKGDMTAVSVFNTVSCFREQRPRMVQTLAQYFFCYGAILRELEELLEGP